MLGGSSFHSNPSGDRKSVTDKQLTDDRGRSDQKLPFFDPRSFSTLDEIKALGLNYDGWQQDINEAEGYRKNYEDMIEQMKRRQATSSSVVDGTLNTNHPTSLPRSPPQSDDSGNLSKPKACKRISAPSASYYTMNGTVPETPLGISVFCLRNTLLKDVTDAGLDETSKIYEIENLENTEFGVIRGKGGNILCPRDEKLGCAYVDCLEGNDNVGPADRMLSYGWGYSIGDIIDALEAYCEQNSLETKKTYVWICCLCNNQHRIEDVVPFAEFQEIFYGTVVGVGHVLAMMAPWHEPLYLTRVWCIFEMHTANTTDSVRAEIIMPPREKEKMLKGLVDYDTIVKVLSSTHIENAKASKESDRVNIMKVVNEETGGATALNNSVNALFRGCFETMVIAAVNEDYATMCFNVGRLLRENDKYEKALELYNKCLKVRTEVYGLEHKDTAHAYDAIAVVMKSKGDLDGSLEVHQKALAVREKIFGKEHADTAASYNNIANVMYNKGDFDGALEMYQTSLAVREKVLGKEHVVTAKTYNNVAVVLNDNGDLDGALEMHQKALAVKEKVLGKEHTDTASSYYNIGIVMYNKGDFDGALEMYQKALAVREKVLGKEHTDTATSYNNIGIVMHNKGDFDSALKMYNKALAIREKVLGKDHSHTLGTKRNMARLKK